jgi:hypothetical protein
MAFILFHDFFPELAEDETLTAQIPLDSGFDLPEGKYSFFELFCDEPGCDCRRVFFMILSPTNKERLALVNYGWESPEFYAKKYKTKDALMIADIKGPSLAIGQRQSSLAPAILELVQYIFSNNPEYIERIKRHYFMFRGAIDGRKQSKPVLPPADRGGRSRRRRR